MSRITPERYRELIVNGLPDFDGKSELFFSGKTECLTEEEVGFFENLRDDVPVPPSDDEIITDQELAEIVFLYAPDDVRMKDAKKWLTIVLQKHAVCEAEELHEKSGRQYAFPTRRNAYAAARREYRHQISRQSAWVREQWLIDGINEISRKRFEKGFAPFPKWIPYWKQNGGKNCHEGDEDKKIIAKHWAAWHRNLHSLVGKSAPVHEPESEPTAAETFVVPEEKKVCQTNTSTGEDLSWLC